MTTTGSSEHEAPAFDGIPGFPDPGRFLLVEVVEDGAVGQSRSVQHVASARHASDITEAVRHRYDR